MVAISLARHTRAWIEICGTTFSTLTTIVTLTSRVPSAIMKTQRQDADLTKKLLNTINPIASRN